MLDLLDPSTLAPFALAWQMPGGTPTRWLPLPGLPRNPASYIPWVARRTPWGRLAYTLYDIYQWYQETQPGADAPPGWEKNAATCDPCTTWNYCGAKGLIAPGPSGLCTQTLWNQPYNPCTTGQVNLLQRSHLFPVWGRVVHSWKRQTGNTTICFDETALDPTTRTLPLPPTRPRTPPRPYPPFYDPAPDPAPQPRPRIPRVLPRVPFPMDPEALPPTRPEARPKPAPGPEPTPGPNPKPKPGAPPLPEPDPDPYAPLDPLPPREPAPPPRRVAERKIASQFLLTLLRGSQRAGEHLDTIKCMHEALRKDLKAKTPRYQNKKGEWVNGKVTTNNMLKAIYSAWVKNPNDNTAWNAITFTECLGKEMLQDALLGPLFRGSNHGIDKQGRAWSVGFPGGGGL